MRNSLTRCYTAGVAASAAPAATARPKMRGEIRTLAGADRSQRVHPGIREQLQRSSEFDADIAIIGTGPAGYYAAIRAAQLGARTVVIERGAVGGVCLNVGCIPTKTLLSSVHVLNQVSNGEAYGVAVESCSINVKRMMERKNAIVKQLTGGVEGLFRKNKVRLVRGHARMTDPHTVTVDTPDGAETIKADKIIIATGSVPAVLPLPGLEIGKNVWTSTEALDFTKIPKSILIVGAGAIGLEAGYMFARMGSEVRVVEMMSQILPAADTGMANELQKHLEAAGIKFTLNATVTRAEDTRNGKKVYVKSGDAEEAVKCEKVLIAVGRRAVLEGVGLDEVGVKHDTRKIIVNERMQTNFPNIYAAGDCVGEPMLAHVGWAEGVVAVEHAMGQDVKMDYKAVPTCVYANPEFASVGLTEDQARDKHGQVSTGKFSFRHNGKALGLGETDGFVKVVAEPKYGSILGVHMVGPHVTDLIAEAVLAIKNELTVDEVIAAIHPHPTLSEVVQEAAMDTEGRAIHK